jgi:putative SOS response-associated peptidase YedK
MCGRYTLIAEGRQWQRKLGLQEEPRLEARYNIAPSELIAIVRRAHGGNHLAVVQWGLVPFWADDAKIAHRLINARGETAGKKPAFRAAMRYRRCLVPADGFYEWQETDSGKQPMYVRLAGGQVFAMAGLWESWESPAGEVRESATILTTEANALVERMHDRMPVIVEPEDYDRWLDPGMQKPEQVQDICRPYPAEEMGAWPVCRAVSNPRYKGADCIQPLEAM